MRVISGTLGGRQFDSPSGFATHPMSDRVRGSLFDVLGDISEKTILDAFAGSGALSFEAISRGAQYALAVERDRRAQHIIEKNIHTLHLEGKVKCIKTSIATWSKLNPDTTFDIIFCDPPYNDLQLSTVSTLFRHLNPNGLMVLSYPGRESVPTVNGVVVVDKRSYGDAALAFYHRSN